MTCSDEEIEQAAADIAGDMIAAARGSAREPVVFVTGNSYYPPIRHYAAADSAYENGRLFELTEELEQLLEDAGVYLDEGPDGSLYAVDLKRFRFTDYDETSDTLPGQWEEIHS